MSTLLAFPGRLALLQRLLPAYRAAFFDTLAASCQGGLSVFAGQAQAEESVIAARDLRVARCVQARNYYVLPVSSPLCMVWQPGLLRWLAEWDADALVVEANLRYLSTPAAVRWMHARKRPVLGWGLGVPDFAGPSRGVLKKLWRDFLHSFDALIAYSQRGAAEYRALGFPAERVFVATNAVAPRPTAPPPQRPPEFAGQPTVLFVGRLQSRKRIDNLLRACAALPEVLQPRLRIVGEGPAQAELQSLARAVYPQAEFLGARRGAALRPLFLAADLFVLPGTGGLAVQEAMANGLPVVVAQGDGTQDDLARPENGWLIPPDDLPALRKTLHRALSDAHRLRQMGTESYRIVAEEINLENMVSVFLHALASTKRNMIE